MKKYTIESLKLINKDYDAEYGIKQSDVDKVNNLMLLIENSRSNDIPNIGDIVNFTDKDGTYYENAHIDSIYDGLYICKKPHIPAIYFDKEKNEILTITKGGPHLLIPQKIKYINSKKKEFSVWGNSDLHFFTEVNVWEYSVGNHEFSTKNYEKFIVSITEDKFKKYKYIIKNNDILYTVFKTDEEYQTWLKIFNGVEQNIDEKYEDYKENTMDKVHQAWLKSFNGVEQNVYEKYEDYKENKTNIIKIVWTYKQEEKFIPLTDYLNIINAVIDSTVYDGKIQECKRVYSENKVTTYMPYEDDMIEL